MMVLQYAEDGSLRNYLDTNKSYTSWKDKIDDFLNIAKGLNEIHKKGLIHRDLHLGNILKFGVARSRITDMGLCKPADYNNTKKSIFGVLPYVAPEILRGQHYTKSSDIYSFGIIMYEVISGLPPYHDLSHNENLAMKICFGLRPRFNIKVPQLIVNLIKRCLDANPLNRPTTFELWEILKQLTEWSDELDDSDDSDDNDDKTEFDQTELEKQIKEADEINNNLPTSPLTSSGLSYETHSEAIYTSRSLNFNNLPEPKNSDDYYKQNDNIISKEFSGSN
jgi:serine/threonine protein kinase